MADDSFIAKAMPFVEAHFGNAKKYATEQEAREAFYQEMLRQENIYVTYVQASAS